MKILHFEIPKKFDEFNLIVDLKKLLLRVRQSEEQYTCTFYDSYDWRLYAKNLTLEALTDGSGLRLSLRDFSSAGEEVILNIASMPYFVWDFPNGALRTKLQPILNVRRLLAQTELRCRRVVLNQLNKDEKTVLRVEIDENVINLPDGKEKRLGLYLNVIEITGYPKPYKKVLEFLRETLQLKPRKRKLLVQVLAAHDRQPLDYSSKPDVQLEPQMRCDAAVKLILRHLNATMLANQNGVLGNVDSEFLHDFRVSIRRIRSVLTQLKKVFPKDGLRPFVADFGWLGKITSPARDLDVYLLSFDQYKAALPISIRDDLEPMRTYLQQRHDKVHEQLSHDLCSKHYQSLIERWQYFLESPLAEQPAEKDATMPIYAIANRRIWSLYQKIIRDGERIDNRSPAQRLHDLRKTGKKLRYMVEIFRSLFANKQYKEAITILKNLQDNLGVFQDYEMQVHTIKAFSQDMMAEKGTPVKALLAMGVLVQVLEKYSHQARLQFADRFSEFESKKHMKLCKDLFYDQ